MDADGILARVALAYPGFRLDVDLALPAAGVTVLFGHSGSGKTTLLRCIAGLERAPGARIAFRGESWQDAAHFLPAHRRPIGYVFQEASLFPHLSARGNLEFARARAERGAEGIGYAQAVELLGIGHLLERRPAQLSGGERQRVAIARALLVNPRLLLMDEPLASLDVQRKQEVLPCLERLKSELRVPIVYVSHAPEEVARLADHLVLLREGRALAAGPLTELLSQLDLPLGLGEDTGVVLHGEVTERDARWHLARVGFAGGALWVRDDGLATGTRVRVRVLARDVSLALAQHTDTSIANALPATVEAIAADAHPGLALVRVALGESRLLARLTQRSVHQLGLSPGTAVWAQVKSAALV
jgi:molybdate transport system ATP-binding protein